MCPVCGSIDTLPAETVWDTDRTSLTPDVARKVAPPVPRRAATRAAGFYGFGCLGLILWILATVYLMSFVAFRASSVFFVLLVSVAGVVLQVLRLFTGNPGLSRDQVNALDEWKVAHAEWQRKQLCLGCKTTFTQSS